MEIAAREAEARDEASKVVEDMEAAAEADAALQVEMVSTFFIEKSQKREIARHAKRCPGCHRS